MWIGKLIGLLIGSLINIPLGTLAGLWLGYLFDKRIVEHWQGFNLSQTSWDRSHAQRAFFEATFAVMGHIAKADGHVSKREIQMAETIMARMRLSDKQRKQAIELFRYGKSDDFDLSKTLQALQQHCRGNRALLQMFIEIQQQAANVDGITKHKQALLQTICQTLGIMPFSFSGFQEAFRNAYQQQQQQQRSQQQAPRPQVADPYSILGVKPDISDVELKRAYRKLMSQNHPDKLVSQGLPEEMIKLATEKTQRIQAAYEQIKQSRGL